MIKNTTWISICFLASKSFVSFDIKAKTAILKDYLSGEIL